MKWRSPNNWVNLTAGSSVALIAGRVQWRRQVTLGVGCGRFSSVAELVNFGKLGVSRAGLASGKPGLLVASRRARLKCRWQVRAGRSFVFAE